MELVGKGFGEEIYVNGKRKKYKICSNVDHWIDYKSRLFYGSKFLNPMRFARRFCHKEAKEFKNSKIVKQKNYYLQNMFLKLVL